MYTNIITIDPSLSCTAINVNDKKTIYTNDITSKNKNDFKRWFKNIEHLADIKLSDSIKKEEHSKNEISKILLYDSISDCIISDIKKDIIQSDNIIILIEGYSQNSIAGPLIDLVTFSTLLRIKLYKNISKNMLIISPLSLKLISAKLTYKPVQKGKKIEYRNRQGISGGKFKKNEILLSLLENENLNCEWCNFLKMNKDDLINKKNVPKPIDDINDAKILYEYGKTL